VRGPSARAIPTRTGHTHTFWAKQLRLCIACQELARPFVAAHSDCVLRAPFAHSTCATAVDGAASWCM
jgi:hypothetical protein